MRSAGDRGNVAAGVAPAVLRWYAGAARDLPWRRPDAAPWAVLVSEVMLQQTPVARVLPVYAAWLRQWPAPSALAAEPRGEAVRMWGRLGYPRRALRLHECAVTITARHGGRVPAELADLLALPGVGPYTARAVLSFAFGQRHAVVDTNVRRVATRAVWGEGRPRSAAYDLPLVEPLVPAEPATAATFAAGLMELGALICTAQAPRCTACPLAACCAWRQAGRPESPQPVPRSPGFAGTDRQVRGLLLGLLRDASSPVVAESLAAVWPDSDQRNRALAGLLADGLAVEQAAGTYSLP